MQRHPRGDPYEREPLDSSYNGYDTPPRHLTSRNHDYAYAQPSSPYRDEASPDRAAQDPYGSQRMPQQQGYNTYSPYQERDDGSSGSRSYRSQRANEEAAPPPPRHADFTSYNSNPGRAPAATPYDQSYAHHAAQSNITPGADNFSHAAAGGMAGIAYNIADQNARESGVQAMRGGGHQLPPPPSRAQYPNANPNYGHRAESPGPNGHDLGYRGYGQNLPGGDSHSSLNPFGTPSATHSPARSLRSFGNESYAGDPYQGMSSHSQRYHDASLGVVNPNDIADDGDDGLHYARRSNRNSMLSLPHSDRVNRNIGPAAAVPLAAGAGAGAAASGLLSGNTDNDHIREKSTKSGKSKKWKWLVIILVFLVVAGAIVGGVVGSMISSNKKQAGGGGGGQSASEDSEKNGDLTLNSPDIKKLLNNKDLHKVFPGMDYTPLNTQYPDCMHNPPSQNNITRDLAVLSQLTNKIRLYGTDCNQTQMLIHAVRQLKMDKDIKIWLGVWQDGNGTTNARQLSQMWDILDEYGADPFEGVIVANEILFRKEKTITELGTILDGVRKNLTSKGLKLPVASSDLGDNWSEGLADKSDYVMANIHPFFAGVSAESAAAWTYNFWETKDKTYWKSDKSKNIIAETGWPSGGGKNCGGATTCAEGSVASVDNMNTFMNDFVCQALANGTNYFWFEAFDEPWKVKFNEPGKTWEDKWGLMDVDRNLKKGIKIPDCDGKTVS